MKLEEYYVTSIMPIDWQVIGIHASLMNEINDLCRRALIIGNPDNAEFKSLQSRHYILLPLVQSLEDDARRELSVRLGLGLLKFNPGEPMYRFDLACICSNCVDKPEFSKKLLQ